MTDREKRWAGYAGGLFGLVVGRALADELPTTSLAVMIVAGLWFVVWLIRDNLRFKAEVAEHRRQLEERKAAHRASKEAARKR